MAQKGFLTLHQDPRIDTLILKQRQIHANDSTIDGFRVQIFMETGNNAVLHADSVKANFKELFPDIPAYLVFGQPYYRLRVGDFRTRLEAENQYQQLKDKFPNSFVTADRIYLPYNPLDIKGYIDDYDANDSAFIKKIFIEEDDMTFDTMYLDSLYKSNEIYKKLDSIFYKEN